MSNDAERSRLAEASEKNIPWKKWGPYLSERQWGTVREDYSQDGDAWDYFTHDQARSRAYRWGEDGLAGISDDHQYLCFALALWNGVDPILKERLFGLSNSEANHGEDVKEYYFYLDSTPTHSYMKYLYKYPQAPYPYDNIVATNKARTRDEFEYELIDTGVFDDDRYFDVFVEYAKESPEDLLIQISVANRGPESATLHVLPTLWFRNTWQADPASTRPTLKAGRKTRGGALIAAEHAQLGKRYLYIEQDAPTLFTENETNAERIFGTPNASPYVKDGIHNAVVHRKRGVVNPKKTGSKAAPHHVLDVGAGETQVLRLRLTDVAPSTLSKAYPSGDPFGEHFAQILESRLNEADRFYQSISPPGLDEDHQRVMRQALAGMLWTKQYYYFDLDRWLEEHDAHPFLKLRRMNVRNTAWVHMLNSDIISMPDKWEYPWYAAWDLAFHTVALAMVDQDFSRQQLELMLNDLYLHPNGQIPAYEWNFSDVNPPVHAWATLFNYNLQKQADGKGDLDFLKDAFNKLLLNFNWWINRKDPAGKNVFEGGFLGLDNIGVFDRSAALPAGGRLEQADGTAWMALYSQNMLELTMQLAIHDPAYADLALRFVQHFVFIAGAMDRMGDNQDEMWDEEDGFYYDLLRYPDGSATRLKVRSMVGLLPLCATTVIPKEYVELFPEKIARIREFIGRHQELLANIAPPDIPGVNGRRLLAVLDETKLRRVLARMLDENEFLSQFGIRSLSRYHLDHPYVFNLQGEEYRVHYLPAESNTGMFGGNSNWRGPIWFPVNILILRALMQYYMYYGDDFKVECPTGSGQWMTLFEVSQEIARRLTSIFLRDGQGRRPVYGGARKFQEDPHWRDHLLFYEYFHGDNGAGLGASHQTGWTGLVAKVIQLFGQLQADHMLEGGTRPMMAVYRRDE